MNDEPTSTPQQPRDQLTIARLMLLTAGVAAGLAFLAPRGEPDQPYNAEAWLGVFNAFVCGLALPAPLFCIPRARRNQAFGTGGLFALTAGLGVLLLLPAGIIEWVAWIRTPPRIDNATAACLYYVLPLMGLWYLMAAIVTGHVRRALRREAPWTDRYGLLLALLWSPQGAWHVVSIYTEVL